MISLAQNSTPYPIIPKKLLWKCTKNGRVYAEKAEKIKTANHCTSGSSVT